MTIVSRAPREPFGGSIREPRRQLGAQIAWFNRLRFVVAAGVIVLSWLAGDVFDVVAAVEPLYAMGALTFALNIGYTIWFPRLRSEAAMRRHVLFQIGLDLLILTTILHFSGGITNPVVLFYTFHTFIASLLLSVRAAILVAAASVLLIAGLGVGELSGWLPHHRIDIGLFHATDDRTGAAMLTWMGALTVVLGVSVFFISTILARLRASEAELKGLSRQLALSEKLASVGTLAAGVSHEINNPIGVISSKTEIMRYRLADGDSEEALLGEIDTIDKHVARIRAITEGLLAFSREAPFELETVEVGALLREARDLARVSFEHAEVRIDLESVARGLRVSGSPNHLLQVLVNVLLNARDASRPGSIVVIRTEATDDEVMIHIVDSGEGIAAENLQRIFDPFFTTKDVGRGTGLGLALSHGLIERHGGRITVDSEVGRGSRFTIVLPRESSGRSG
ncbi:MAG: hypothetical protein KDB80_10480 [Planctomycetes bacterium]|nr:hypothetical protein [Planctomycetota bacterium]